MRINFLYNIFVFTILLFGVNLSAQAQKLVDLQMSIISPQKDEVIFLGDSILFNISIKNLGPDTLFGISDQIYYALDEDFGERIERATIFPSDSIILKIGYGVNTDSRPEKLTFCVYLLPYSTTYVETNKYNNRDCTNCFLSNLSKIDSKKYFTISPNPASNTSHLNFYVENAQPIIVVMRDLLGREFIHKDLGVLSGSQKQQIDISSLPPGMYLVELRTDNQHWIQKLIVN